MSRIHSSQVDDSDDFNPSENQFFNRPIDSIIKESRINHTNYDESDTLSRNVQSPGLVKGLSIKSREEYRKDEERKAREELNRIKKRHSPRRSPKTEKEVLLSKLTQEVHDSLARN